MLYLRYMGEFLSRRGVRWRVELLQESEEAFAKVGLLDFDADEALVIEWDERSKEEVLCGSMATLSIISPGDRTYADLYTESPGSIRMDVYREGELYWCGLLDAEFYEEPYEMARGYVVSLKFGDFGAMDRMKWVMTGMPTLMECLRHCVDVLGLPLAIDDSLVSSRIEGSDRRMSLADLKVRADNFCDEDGELGTLEDVAVGVLQPLALRMVQRCGKIWVYDLNGLYGGGDRHRVTWDGSTQTLGVDRVYNNATVTWSAYVQSGDLLPEKCWTQETDRNAWAMNYLDGREVGECRIWSYHYSTDIADWIDLGDCGFTLWTATSGKNGRLLMRDAVRWFKIVTQYDGQEAEGVAISWSGVAGVRQLLNGGYSESFQVKRNGIDPRLLAGTIDATGRGLFRTQEVWIPPTDDGRSLMLRVAMELLMDPRFNPHEEAVNWSGYLDQKNWQATWRTYGNYVYVPVTIKFQPDGEDVVYCWDNRDVVSHGTSYGVRTVEETKGKWVKYETASEGSDDDPLVWGYLCWYDPSDRVDSCGVAQGWRANRPAINPHRKSITTALEHCDDGQYIPYPMQGGGRLWMEVRYGGWMICNENDAIREGMSGPNNPHGLWGLGNDVRGPRMNWILMKMPRMEILNNLAFDQEIATDDVEYKAELNSNAKEDVSIETVCGTCAEGYTTARGAYYETESGRMVRRLKRGERTTQVEELLIGTLYSQFSRRMTKIEGEAMIVTDGVAAYTEANQGDRLFLLTRDEQNLICDVSQVSMVEFRPDEYDQVVL